MGVLGEAAVAGVLGEAAGAGVLGEAAVAGVLGEAAGVRERLCGGGPLGKPRRKSFARYARNAQKSTVLADCVDNFYMQVRRRNEPLVTIRTRVRPASAHGQDQEQQPLILRLRGGAGDDESLSHPARCALLGLTALGTTLSGIDSILGSAKALRSGGSCGANINVVAKQNCEFSAGMAKAEVAVAVMTTTAALLGTMVGFVAGCIDHPQISKKQEWQRITLGLTLTGITLGLLHSSLSAGNTLHVSDCNTAANAILKSQCDYGVKIVKGQIAAQTIAAFVAAVGAVVSYILASQARSESKAAAGGYGSSAAPTQAQTELTPAV